MNTIQARLDPQAGFTLVELLVVIAIIGVLTAIGLPMYQGYQATAKMNASKENLANAKNFVAAEVTKCNTGTNLTAAVPNITLCSTNPTGVTAAVYRAYFATYFTTIMKNPYGGTAAVIVNAQPANPGEIMVAVNGTNITLQTRYLDSSTNVSTLHPTTAESISINP